MAHIITGGSIEEFRLYLQREERSANTVDKYVRDLETFCIWLRGEPVTKEKVTEWKTWLIGRAFAAVTVNTKLASLHSFFRFMGWSELNIRYLKIQRKVFRDSSRELNKNEYERLVSTALSRGNVRLALIIETICATGIRVSELRYISVEALRAGKAEVSLKGKIRSILIPNRLSKKLLKYAGKQKIASGEVFITKSGKGISRRQVWGEMKSLYSAAGVEGSKVFPHNLRHLFARIFYKASRDIVRLADVLGHSSVETTRIYLMSSCEEYAKQLDSLGLVL